MTNKEKIEKLRAEIAALEAIENDHPVYKLARLLHEETCGWNHVDGCGWFYEMDGKLDKWNGSAHKKYLDWAKRAVGEMSAKTRGSYGEKLDAVIVLEWANLIFRTKNEHTK